MKAMTARYAGRCGGCGIRFKAGTRIMYGGSSRVFHASCVDADGKVAPPPSDSEAGRWRRHAAHARRAAAPGGPTWPPEPPKVKIRHA